MLRVWQNPAVQMQSKVTAVREFGQVVEDAKFFRCTYDWWCDQPPWENLPGRMCKEHMLEAGWKFELTGAKR